MDAQHSFIGRYQVLERLAEGGMGTLYLARDPAIDRLVTIKVLRHGFDSDEARERFSREARAAGRLHHPHVVTIFDVGEHEGKPFIAMEFLAGETLAQLIRQRARLTLTRKLTLIEELCDGLAYAHRAGLVHRDIKPANVMVDAQGVLKILDFGIVRIEESGITDAGAIVGTINYMSPEQVSGSAVDHRSDIFCTGVVAYELLSYRQAFPGTIKDGLIDRILAARVAPLQDVCPDLDLDVVRIVQRALAPSPAERYQDLARMRNEIARARRRLELKEAEDETSFAEETAVYPLPPTPGPGTQPPGSGLHTPPSGSWTPPSGHVPAPEMPGSGAVAPTPGSSRGGVPLVALAEDEHALSTGRYQLALNLASQSAVLQPDSGQATSQGPGSPDSGSPGSLAEPMPSAADDGASDVAAPGVRRPNLGAKRIYALVGVLILAIGVSGVAWLIKQPNRRTGQADQVRAAASASEAASPSEASTPSSARVGPPASAEQGSDGGADAAMPAPAGPAPSDASQLAQRHLSGARRDRALDTIATGLRDSPEDRELIRTLRGLLEEARGQANGARRAAEAAGAAAGNSDSFADGLRKLRAAEALRVRNDLVQSVREFSSAGQLFAKALDEARAAKGQASSRTTSGGRAQAIEPPPVVAPNSPVRAGAPAGLPPAADDVPRSPPAPGAGNRTAERAQTPTPAPVDNTRPSPPPPPAAAPRPADSDRSTPPASSPTSSAQPTSSAAQREAPPSKTAADTRADEAAIRDVLRAYQAAWEELDYDALRRVQELPGESGTRVRETMNLARDYRIQLDVDQVVVASNGRSATARCRVIREFHPRIGRTTRQAGASEFRLEKRDDRWVIVELR